MKPIMFNVDDKVKDALKLRLSQRGTTIRDFLTQAITAEIKPKNGPGKLVQYFYLSPKKEQGAERRYIKSGGKCEPGTLRALKFTDSRANKFILNWHEPLFKVPAGDLYEFAKEKKIAPCTSDLRGNYSVLIPACYTDMIRMLSRSMGCSHEQVVVKALESLNISEYEKTAAISPQLNALP